MDKPFRFFCISHIIQWMFRKLVLGIITTGFMFGVFFAPISPALQSNTGFITPNYAYAQEPAPPQAQPETEINLSCDFTDIFCGIVKFVVGIWMFVSQMVLVAVSLILDVAINFSLSSSSYTGDVGTFIDTGWKIVRDFTNILFIFGLLVAAFYLILQPKKDTVGIGSDPKRIVVMVIIMALLVNFSLFFTKVIIDLGNVPARVFYEKIATIPGNITGQGEEGQTLVQKISGTVVDKSIALSLISKINPQSIILNSGAFADDPNVSMDTITGKLFYLFIGFIIFIINIVIIYIFGTMILIFLGRTFMLWMAMVLSPLAFVLKAVPIGFLKDFSFDTWIRKTAELAFLAPLFMFFVYLAVTALNITFGSITDNGGIMAKIVTSSIQLIAVAFILLKGKTLAVKMSGEVGEMVSKASGSIAALGVGAVTGGTAFMARQTLGRAGAAVANSDRLRDIQAKGIGASKFGAIGKGVDMMTRSVARKTIQGGREVEGSSMDIRNAKVFGQTLQGSVQRLDKGFVTGDRNQRNVGYTKAKEEDASKKKSEIEAEMNAAISTQNGALQQDTDRKKAKLNGIGPMSESERKAVDNLKTSEKMVGEKEKAVGDKEKVTKEAQEKLESSDPAKKIKEVQSALRDYLEETKEDFDNMSKEIKQAESDSARHDKTVKDLNGKLAPQKAEYANIEKIPEATRTPEQKARMVTLSTNINDLSTQKATAQKSKEDAEYHANAVRNSAAYTDIKNTKTKLTEDVTNAKDAARNDAGFQSLAMAVKNAKDAVKKAKREVLTAQENVKSAKNAPDYKKLEQDVKKAEKAFNDAQVSRLESIAGRNEKWVDTQPFGNSTFDPGVNAAGRVGRAYEGFAGSTKGTRQGAESVRGKIKEYSKK